MSAFEQMAHNSLFSAEIAMLGSDSSLTNQAPVDLAIIVPVYNGLDTLEELVIRSIKAISSITESFTIILVDDRGHDNCWPLICKLSSEYSQVRGIQLSRNFGQHRALTAGIDHINAKWYVVMDCDLQDAPEDVTKLLTVAADGFDVVVATRNKAGHSLFKRNSSRPFYWLFTAMSGLTLDWNAGNFRAFSYKVADAYRDLREEERFLPAAFSWMGFEVGAVELDHHPRQSGRSSYSIRKLLNLASDVIFSYSELPLRIVAGFGFIMSLISIALATIYIVKALIFGNAILGWTSLIVAVFVLGSIQIFMIGVVGLYVGKTFRETKRRPLYLVREFSGFENRSDKEHEGSTRYK